MRLVDDGSVLVQHRTRGLLLNRHSMRFSRGERERSAALMVGGPSLVIEVRQDEHGWRFVLMSRHLSVTVR